MPLGWGKTTFLQYIQIEKSGNWGNDVSVGNYKKEVNCIRGADFPSLKGEKNNAAPIRFINENKVDLLLKDGDVIIEISGGSPTQSTGRICYINEYTLKRFQNDLVTSNFCRAFSINKNSQYWFYLQWSRLYDAGVLFGFEGKTTGIKNLMLDVFCETYKIVQPASKIIEDFNKRVEPIFNNIQKINIENDKLTELRDWLLPMLMNGQATIE